MSVETVALRERLLRELGELESVEAAVFTTYTFVPDFFEENVLPLLFGIEGRGRTRLRVQTNSRLRSTPVALFYDMTTQPRGGGEYRYQWVPVKVDRGIFHPKITIVGGTRKGSGEAGVLVCVASANLTRQAWGRNEEVAGTFWVKTEAQRDELLALLDFLDRHAERAAIAGKGEAPADVIEALPRVRALVSSLEGLAGRPKGYPRFRCFGLGRAGEVQPAAVITPGRRWWDYLTAFSPYWSNREDCEALAKGFRARNCWLVPAPRASGHPVRLGFDAGGDVTEHAVVGESLRRFRHAKLYLAEGRFLGIRRARVTVGSVNFTTGALGVGGRAPVNVEAVVAYDIKPRQVSRIVPELGEMPDGVEAESEGISEDEDRPMPFVIYVTYDWTAREYRVRLTDVRGAKDFVVVLPGAGEHRIDAGDQVIRSESGPRGSRDFSVRYLYTPADGTPEAETAHGLITELGLDQSDHRYTPALKLEEFFASWLRPDPDDVHDKLAGKAPDDEEEDSTGALEGISDAPVDQLDATNLFETYRALRELEQNHLTGEDEAEQRGLAREYLVSRPDSVDQLVRLLERQQTNRGVRLALLLECARLFKDHGGGDLGGAAERAAERIEAAVSAARAEVLDELRASERVGRSAEETLSWFERQLAEAWR